MDSSDTDVIVFDAMRVIFKEGDDTDNLLIPFIERECAYTDRSAIRHLYMEASLGHISSRNSGKKQEETTQPPKGAI